MATTVARFKSSRIFPLGHMKNILYETPVESEEDLLARILAASEITEHTPSVWGVCMKTCVVGTLCATNNRVATWNHTCS